MQQNITANENTLQQAAQACGELCIIKKLALNYIKGDKKYIDSVAACLSKITNLLCLPQGAASDGYGKAVELFTKAILFADKAAVGDVFAVYEDVCFTSIYNSIVVCYENKKHIALNSSAGEMLFEFANIVSVKNETQHAMFRYLLSSIFNKLLPQLAYTNLLCAFAKVPNLREALGIKFEGEGGYSPAEQSYTTACLSCGEEGVPYYAALQMYANNYQPNFEPAKLWMKCKACGNLFAYNFPILQQEDFVGCDITNKDEQLTSRYDFTIFAEIANKLKNYTSGTKWLEVGIGNGELMAVAAELGYSIQGVEIAVKEATKVKQQLGFEVECIDFLNFKTQNKYDIITMGDVIEHMTAPVKALKQAYELLNNDGVLWLSTPSYSSAQIKFNGFADPMWKEPWHMSYFSKETLLPIMSNIGFEMQAYDISRRYVGCMEMVFTKKGGN